MADLSWELEPSHFPQPLTRWANELFCTLQTSSIARLASEYGLLLEGVAMREFDGRVYTAVVPLGGKVRKPPPPFLVPLLVKLVPELRRRIARGREAEARDEMGRALESWLTTDEPRMLAVAHDLSSRDLTSLSDAELAGVLDEAMALAAEGIYVHFKLHGVAVFLIGRLGHELCTKHGWTTAEFTDLFTGLSDTSTGPGGAQAAIVELVQAAGGHEALASASSLDDVRAISADVSAAIDDYLRTWGARAIRYETAYPTVAERPQWLLRALQEQARHTVSAEETARRASRRAEATERAVRDVGGDDDARRRVERAQRCFPVREGNETATVGLPVAAMRRVGLEAGRRLAEQGSLERHDDVFDLEVAEVLAALRGSGAGKDAVRSVAAERRRAREKAAEAIPPEVIGPPPSPPPALAGFPADVTANVEGLLWYMNQILGKGGERTASGVEGLIQGDGVSSGVYEGPARVVMDEGGLDTIEAGDVLVCPITSPVWSFVFPYLGALVCDAGGVMSHPAIIAREFGLPAVVGTGVATASIKDGDVVRVDGAAGTVTIVGDREVVAS